MKRLSDRIPLWALFLVVVAMCVAVNIMALLGILPLDMGVACLVMAIIASACVPVAIIDEKMKKITKEAKERRNNMQEVTKT